VDRQYNVQGNANTTDVIIDCGNILCHVWILYNKKSQIHAPL